MASARKGSGEVDVPLDRIEDPTLSKAAAMRNYCLGAKDVSWVY